MAKKTKSKARLDKFYKIAKEQGYRSRAAFKLIQLNKKHNFLQNATVLIDLCAAPGGWLQVASKYMPSSSIILGIDLDPIKPIPNVKSFQADITSAECMAMIKKEIKHLKVDVVLNDGAPNVGSSWTKDAYTQSELVMHALKLATQVLKKNGVFVTKIFRSTDYSNLIWLFNKFFTKVEATKPEASRVNSAEIFVVCQGYNAPDIIDPRFFDPKYVFKNNENDILAAKSENGVNSIKKIFEIKKRRSIADNTPLTMHKTITLKDFVGIDNPYAVFVNFNKIAIEKGSAEQEVAGGSIAKQKQAEDLIDYSTLVPYPADFEEMCADLKLLSKKQVAGLIKWRAKVINCLNKQKKPRHNLDIEEEQEEQENGQMEEEEIEEEELRETEYAQTKKEDRDERKMQEKQLLKYVKTKMINDTEVVGGEQEEELADFEFTNYAKQVRKGKYIDVDGEKEKEAEMAAAAEAEKKESKKKKMNSFNEMSDNIEYLYEQKKKANQTKGKEPAPPSTEIVSMIKTKRAMKEEQEKGANSTLFKQNETKNGANGKDAKVVDQQAPQDINIEELQNNSKWFGKKIFDLLKNQTTNTQVTTGVKPEPQKDFRRNLDDFDSESDSDEEALIRPTKGKNHVEKNVQEEQEMHALLEETGKYNLDKMTDDDLAEMLALSKKMLRKKQRRAIIDSSYNRNNFPEDPNDLPAWFYEDEKKHMGAIPMITKEDVLAEKEKLMMLKNRLPKKVLEAKYRKKKKMVNNLKKAQSEAAEIYENEGLSPFTKARSINQLYRKAIKKSKPKKKQVIVSKRHLMAAPNKKSGRKFVMVDKRLRKDLRAQKKAENLKKGKKSPRR